MTLSGFEKRDEPHRHIRPVCKIFLSHTDALALGNKRFNGFVDFINKGFAVPNKVTRDLVLKASLVVGDHEVVYNVKNFTTEVIAKIERNWVGIKRAIENTFRLLNRYGLAGDNLGSLNAVLPLVYYI